MKEHKNSYGIFSLLNFYTRVNILLPKQQPLNQLDYNESWAPKNWCFWAVVLEKILESHLDCKEIKPVNPKGNQPWIFIGKTVVEAEAPIFWPPNAKSWLIWKDFDAGKDWRQEEKETTENEMVGWHHRLNGHGFGWTPGVGDEQGGLACCDSWGCRSRTQLSYLTELNWTAKRKLEVNIGTSFVSAAKVMLKCLNLVHYILEFSHSLILFSS